MYWSNREQLCGCLQYYKGIQRGAKIKFVAANWCIQVKVKLETIHFLFSLSPSDLGRFCVSLFLADPLALPPGNPEDDRAAALKDNHISERI